MKSTIIQPCSCAHEFQDKVYGKGKRVFNVMQKTKEKKCRCTVCLSEKPYNDNK